MGEMTTAAYWDARYAGDEYRFGEAPNAFVAREAKRLAPGAKVLAIADGEGRNSVFLAQCGLDVHATEISPVALSKARKLAAAKGVSVAFEQADLLAWDWPHEHYDAVFAIFIQFAGPADRAKIFQSMKRALKPGGMVFIEGYRPEQLAYNTGGPRLLENLYDEAILREAFADFEIISLAAYDAEVNEGPGHAGMSALIDLIAQKPAT